MPLEFSEMEQSIIKNMMLRKSHKEICSVLECGIAELVLFIATEVEETDIVTWQMKLDEKKPVKKIPAPVEKKVPDPKLKKLKPAPKNDDTVVVIAAYRKARAFEVEQKNKRRPPAYKTLIVDYTQLVRVKIDRQTTIYSKPGEEEKTKARFLETYVKPIDRF